MTAGLATSLCAILNHVPISDLMIDEADPSLADPIDSVDMGEYYQHHHAVDHRALYEVGNNTNRTGGTETTGLDTGAIVGLSIAGVLIGLTLLACAWWYCIRSRQARLQGGGYAATLNEPPEFAPGPYPGGSASIFANMAGTDELRSTMQRTNESAASPYSDLSGIPLLTLGRRGANRC